MARRGRGTRACIVVVALLSLARPAVAQEYPPFSSYVVDAAGVVPDDVERSLVATLRDYQVRTTNQVAVAVVRTTGGRPIEDYSLGLANTWGLGQQGKNNGVLVLIAYDDRRLRIEVGLGLESVLTDQAAAGIIDGGMVPRMRQGDVGGAVVFATESIRRVLGDPVSVAAVPAQPVVPAPQPAPTVQTDARPRQAPFVPGPYRAVRTQPMQPAPYQPLAPVGRGGGSSSGPPGWFFGLFVLVAAFAVVGSLGRGRQSGYRRRGPMIWGHGGWGHDHHQRSGFWGSSGGTSGGGSSGGLGGGGSFGGGGGSSGGGSSGGSSSSGGGGGGSFGGGGASGSW